MRLILLLLGLSVMALSQPAPATFGTFTGSTPSGSCANGPLQYNFATGLYGCLSGTWTQLNGGGGTNPTGTTSGVPYWLSSGPTTGAWSNMQTPLMGSGSYLQLNGYNAGGGSANAQTVTLTGCPTSLSTGIWAFWLPVAANTTTTPTLAVCGYAAKTITKNGTAALAASDLTTTAVAWAIYDGTEWQLQNPQSGGGGAWVPAGTASGYQSTASGTGSVASGYNSTANGVYSTASGVYSIANGVYAVANATGTTANGYDSVASGNYSIALGNCTGYGSTLPANSFFVGGAGVCDPSSFVSDWFGGTPDTAPRAFTIHAQPVIGTNVAGSNEILAGGQSTGTGAGGSVILATSPAGSTGTVQNALVNRLAVNPDGTVQFITAPPTSCSGHPTGTIAAVTVGVQAGVLVSCP